MTSVVQVLKEAKERVQRGWLQGAACNNAMTRVCAAQAVNMAALERASSNCEATALMTYSLDFLLAAAREQTQHSWGNVPMWNDHEGRTQAEVVDTFDHAIKLAERDGSDQRPTWVLMFQ